MTPCESECDCGRPNPAYGPHDPDCHSFDHCGETRTCDKHAAEAMADHAYLRGAPRHTVFNDQQAKDERDQELRDAGRGHLVTP